MHKPRFFKDDGSLQVRVPPRAARWIDFLTYSRLCNSTDEEGGWNNKKLWMDTGLIPLSENKPVLALWTQNSLADSKTYPRPREEDFKLGRDANGFSKERSAAESKFGNRSIEAWSENSINARLFKKFAPPNAVHCSPFPLMSLLAYEVPLCDDADGQMKVDLLALRKRDDVFHVALIELKQANSPANSPLLALVECICYALQVTRCRTYLIRESKKESRKRPHLTKLTDEHFKRISLVIAAPQLYWKYWNCWEASDVERVQALMRRLLAGVNQSDKLKQRGVELELDAFTTLEDCHLLVGQLDGGLETPK